ncbi:MAG: hypothetical protein ACRD3O_17225 [Terriglobia bacterium]
MIDRETRLGAPTPLTEEEDEVTLAALDKGADDADAGRVTPIEEVEKMLPQWISKSSSLTKH